MKYSLVHPRKKNFFCSFFYSRYNCVAVENPQNYSLHPQIKHEISSWSAVQTVFFLLIDNLLAERSPTQEVFQQFSPRVFLLIFFRSTEKKRNDITCVGLVPSNDDSELPKRFSYFRSKSLRGGLEEMKPNKRPFFLFLTSFLYEIFKQVEVDWKVRGYKNWFNLNFSWRN